VLSFGGATTGITYSTQSGAYTRIGNIVHFNMNIALSSVGSASGAAAIGGLPYATTASTYSWAGTADSTTLLGSTVYASFGMYNVGSTTSSLFVAFPNGANNSTNAAQLTNANFTSASNLFVDGFYFTTASP
jgi:hypothetical protein